MAYVRLTVEMDEEGWVVFRQADRPFGELSRGEFQLPNDFALSDVLTATRATGRVVDRDGSLWIDQQTDCSALAGMVCEMLFYFDAPAVPSKRLLRIKQAVDRWLSGAGEDKAELSLWTCAWLDLMVREDAKEDVMTAEDVWNKNVLEVDIARHCERRLREVLQRSYGRAEVETPEVDAGRMAPSERTRRVGDQRRKDVG